MPEMSWDELAERRLAEATGFWSADWQRAVKNYDFYRGEHKTEEEKARLEAAERADVSWNDILTIVNSATGREIMSRFQPSFRGRIKRLRQTPPMEMLDVIYRMLSPETRRQLEEELEDDSAGAQALTELERWIRQSTDADTEDSQTFLDAFVTGWGCQEHRMDWVEDPDGKIIHDNLYPWEVAPDPLAKKRNLKDMNYVFRFREVTEEEMRAVYGEKTADRLVNAASRHRATMKSGGVETQAALYGFQNNQGFYDPTRRTFIVTEYEFRDRMKDLVELDHPRTGEPLRFEGEEEFKAFKAEMGAQEVPGVLRRQRYRYKRALLAGTEVLEDAQDAPIQAFSFLFITCFPHRTKVGTKWFGLVDVGRDPQRWKDKFMGVMIDMVARSPKAPVHAEKNAFEDLQTARDEITRDDGLVIYQEGAITRGKVKFGAGPTYPRGFEPLFLFAKDGLRDSMGLSQVATGQLSDPRRAPFATVNALQQAAQLNLAQPFDGLRIFRRLSAHVDLLYAADYLTVDTIRSVIGFEHVANLPEPESESYFGSTFKRMKRFDLVTDESPTTPTSIQEIMAQLTQTQLFQVLQQAGAAPPPGVLIDMFVEMGLPAQMGEQWKLSMMQAGQDPNQPGMGPEVALQQILPSLSPGVREAVLAEVQQQTAGQAPAPTTPPAQQVS